MWVGVSRDIGSLSFHLLHTCACSGLSASWETLVKSRLSGKEASLVCPFYDLIFCILFLLFTFS